MRIGELADRAGVGVETVRFYQRRGLLEPPPRPLHGGYRSYPEAAVQRIRFVRQAQRLGFSLAEVEELLALAADPAAGCADIRGQAQAKLTDIDARIAGLGRMRNALSALVDACQGTGAAAKSCPILRVLDHADEPEREA